MRIEANEPCPLPGDPVLSEWAETLRDAGDWGWIVDSSWRLIFMTNEQRFSFSAGVEMVPIVLGEHLFGSEMVSASSDWRAGPTLLESWGELLSAVGGFVLADTPGGKNELRAIVDPSFARIVDGLVPSEASATFGSQVATGPTSRGQFVLAKALRIRDAAGALRGTAILYKPAAGMNILGTMAFERDLGHLERMRSVARASRRPAAILFADLESSSALSRTLSTGSYFATGRRIVRVTDECVVDAGGVVGRHVGDGVVAYFPVEVFESESSAARACMSAARAIQGSMPRGCRQVGAGSGRPGDAVRPALGWARYTWATSARPLGPK